MRTRAIVLCNIQSVRPEKKCTSCRILTGINMNSVCIALYEVWKFSAVWPNATWPMYAKPKYMKANTIPK